MTATDRRMLALVLLSAAMLVSFGDISAWALGLMLLAAAVAIFAIRPSNWNVPRLPAQTAVLMAALAATAIFYERDSVRPVIIASVVAVILSLIIHSRAGSERLRRVAFALAMLTWVGMLVANFRWGSFNIDVFNLQQGAAAALLRGQNPYAPSFVLLGNYGVKTGALIHFPYGPIIPILEMPFRALGDVRVLHMIAAVITAATFIVASKRSGAPGRGRMLVMAFPLFIGIIVYSWIDVITMAGFCVWLLCMRSHPRLATLALAVSLGGKPTTLVALLPALFWSARARRQAIIAALVAAAVVLPFAAITGFSQFYQNVVGLDLQLAPRTDALTINSWLQGAGMPLLPVAVSLAVVLATTVGVLAHKPSTYGELLTGTAVLTILSMLVAKWAYYNYYYIAAVVLALGVAADALPLDTPELIHPPAPVLWLWNRWPGRRALAPSPTLAAGSGG